MTNLPKGYVSFTQLSLFGGFMGCELAYFYRYVEKRKLGRPGPALLLGNVWDDALNQVHNFQITQGALPKPDLAAETVGDSWNRRLEKEEYDLTGADGLRGRAQEEAKRYVTDFAPNLEPQIVQRRVRHRLPTGAVLLGDIDLIEGGGRKVLTDGKASTSPNRKFDVPAAVADLQLSLYDLVMNLEGEPMDGYGWRFLRMLPGSAVQGETLVRATPEARQRAQTVLEQLISRMEMACESGIFLPSAKLAQSFKCSEKFCEFYPKVCPHGARARTAIPMSPPPKHKQVSFPGLEDDNDEALPE